MIKRKSILFGILFLIPMLVIGQSNSKKYSKQDRFSVLYSYHFDETMRMWYLMALPHLDIKYRMSNYTDELDFFSLTGKMGIQGFYAYLHFGPEVKLLDIFFINSTLGIYAGYIGIGLIGEAELGFRTNIYKKLYVEGLGVWQLFYPGINISQFAPSLKIGLGLSL